jgi:succinyl-CoA synthetase alpha subunit
VYALTQRRISQTTCVGIGSDPVNGTNFIDVLQMFEKPQTEKVVMIGGDHGTDEEKPRDIVTTLTNRWSRSLPGRRPHPAQAYGPCRRDS